MEEWKNWWWYCWWFKNPAPVEVGSLSHYLQGFLHTRWWSPDFWTINGRVAVVLEVGRFARWSLQLRRVKLLNCVFLGRFASRELSVCCFFLPKKGWISDMMKWSTLMFFSKRFFPPSIKALLAQVGMHMNGQMIYNKQKHTCVLLKENTLPDTTTFPRHHPRLSTQDLDAWRIGRTEVVGRQEQGRPGKNDPMTLAKTRKLDSSFLWSTKKKQEPAVI